MTDPAFEKAAFALKNRGDLTEPVLSSFGYHIIRLEGRKASRPLSFDEVKAKIIEEMRAAFINETRDAQVARIRSDPKLQVNQEAVDALVVRVEMPPHPSRVARPEAIDAVPGPRYAVRPRRGSTRSCILPTWRPSRGRRSRRRDEAATGRVRATVRSSSTSSRASSPPAISAASPGSRGRFSIRWRCSRSTTSCSRRYSAPRASTERASCCSSPSRCGRGSRRRKVSCARPRASRRTRGSSARSRFRTRSSSTRRWAPRSRCSSSAMSWC